MLFPCPGKLLSKAGSAPYPPAAPGGVRALPTALGARAKRGPRFFRAFPASAPVSFRKRRAGRRHEALYHYQIISGRSWGEPLFLPGAFRTPKSGPPTEMSPFYRVMALVLPRPPGADPRRGRRAGPRPGPGVCGSSNPIIPGAARGLAVFPWFSSPILAFYRHILRGLG